jgi:hypothetical protein
MKRVWGLVVRPAVLILAISIPVAGCSNVCPAIGWVNTVTVELEGETSRVSILQLCEGAACSELAPGPAPSALRSVMPSPFEPSATAPPPTGTPSPQRTMAPFYGQQIDADTWRFTVMMGSPDHVRVKAISDAGVVLIEEEARLEWKRVGGSAQCGGPSEASPIRLTVTAG